MATPTPCAQEAEANDFAHSSPLAMGLHNILGGLEGHLCHLSIFRRFDETIEYHLDNSTLLDTKPLLVGTHTLYYHNLVGVQHWD